MKSPRETKVEQNGCHRLIPHQYSDDGQPILNRLAQDDGDLLKDLTELEGATNDRLLAESGKHPGLSAVEVVSGFSLVHIVNASFSYASEVGGRFNGAGRGAWYSAFEMLTAQTEVGFHREVWLKENAWSDVETYTYIDYLSDFWHEFHDIQADLDFANCLDPNSDAASQALGLQLLTSGSAGIVYPSVRRKDGVCIACFRPSLVLNVRRGPMVQFTFAGTKMTEVIVR
jgi:RES domain-containing protein